MSTIIDVTAPRRRIPARLASDGWWLDPPPRIASAPPVADAVSRSAATMKRQVRP